jgi:hypothetical protein
LTEEDWLEAKQFQHEASEIVTRYGPNYTGLHADFRFGKGRLGELALRGIFERCGVWFMERRNPPGTRDGYDFVVRRRCDNKQWRIDVKTSNYGGENLNLLIPKKAWDKRRLDLYLACHRNDNECIMVGGIRREEFDALKRDFEPGLIPTWAVKYDDLPYTFERIVKCLAKV